MATHFPDRLNSYVPEDIEIVKDLGSLSMGQIEELAALNLAEMEEAFKRRQVKRDDAFIWPFTGLVPNVQSLSPITADTYAALLDTYLREESSPDTKMVRRVVGAVVGERVKTRRWYRDLLQLHGMYTAPSINIDGMRKKMISSVKDLLDDFLLDEIRVMFTPNQPDLDEEMEWFAAQGFIERKYSFKHQAYILAWEPEEEQTSNRASA